MDMIWKYIEARSQHPTLITLLDHEESVYFVSLACANFIPHRGTDALESKKNGVHQRVRLALPRRSQPHGLTSISIAIATGLLKKADSA